MQSKMKHVYLLFSIYTCTQFLKINSVTGIVTRSTLSSAEISEKSSVNFLKGSTDLKDGEKTQKELTPINVDDEPFDKLFFDGIQAYKDEMWYSCASKLEKSIEAYHSYKDKMIECRISCSGANAKSENLANIARDVWFDIESTGSLPSSQLQRIQLASPCCRPLLIP